MTLTALGIPTPRRLIIEVHQLPPAECSPNARVHWSARYRYADDYKAAVYYTALDARNAEERRRGLRCFPFALAVVRFTLVFAQRRRRDIDNLVARCKPGIDALVRAGILVDDRQENLRWMPPAVEVDRQRAPLTVIEIEERR